MFNKCFVFLVLQVVLHERSGPRKDLYNIKFQKEECYLFCDENDNVTIGQVLSNLSFPFVFYDVKWTHSAFLHSSLKRNRLIQQQIV